MAPTTATKKLGGSQRRVQSDSKTGVRTMVSEIMRPAFVADVSEMLEAFFGAKPTLAVLDAEREALAAQAAMIEAEGQRLVAAWQLNALTGAVSK